MPSRTTTNRYDNVYGSKLRQLHPNRVSDTVIPDGTNCHSKDEDRSYHFVQATLVEDTTEKQRTLLGPQNVYDDGILPFAGMVPDPSRRRLLQASAAGLAAGVPGCGGLLGSPTPNPSPTNAGSSAEYDLLVRHRFDYDFPDSEPHDLELTLGVKKFANATDAGGETVFERTVRLAPEPATRRFTDAFDASNDVYEWLVQAELRMLIDTPVIVEEDILDAPDSVATGLYRFRPGSDRDPENGVVVITTADDGSEENSARIERLRVDTVESLTEVTGTAG